MGVGGDAGSVWVGALIGSFIIALALIAGVVVFYRRRFTTKRQIYLEKTAVSNTGTYRFICCNVFFLSGVFCNFLTGMVLSHKMLFLFCFPRC